MKEEDFEGEEEFDEIVEELSDEEESEITGGKTTTTASTVVSMKTTCTEKKCKVGREIRTEVDPKINYIIDCADVTSNYDTSSYWCRFHITNNEKFKCKRIEKSTQI